MAVNIEHYKSITAEIGEKVKLVAVTKVRTVEEIRLLYNLGQRDFGENYVQELVEKRLVLPHDIRWHFIGHLQSNKVKYIAPFVHLIHGVDSFKLLEEIEKQANLHKRSIGCLLQVHIAQEETKYGLNEVELKDIIKASIKLNTLNSFQGIRLCGLMGMASFTENTEQVAREFKYLKCLFDDLQDEVNLPSFKTLSMGMSGDYK
ncbi:MAG TPA: YggS family pyridoxal phosphate-dependent enzyme, partial [Chitinophagaceae bacterium]|nr:YggS family pyridoxal phosphate-dependent enzyme [Chitinophagaceae bacterium]